jgi:hypothetical protein
MKRNNKAFALVAVSLFLVVGFIYIGSNRSDTGSQSNISNVYEVESSKADEDIPENVANSTEEESLKYLIEEEKLAHDVYMVMYEKYGTRIFSNIMESEITHQEKVLSLLESRDIEDPRSESVGVFKNQELQSLYDQLIELGNKSQQDAIKVGIMIEERDIADLTVEIQRTSDGEVKSVLEELKKASENHLKAFQRQS